MVDSQANHPGKGRARGCNSQVAFWGYCTCNTVGRVTKVKTAFVVEVLCGAWQVTEQPLLLFQ